MAISKVVYDGKPLIDLTGDTVEADKLLRGITAHGADGEPIVGECPYDMDTSEATAKAAEILSGKTAGVKGSMVEGTMPNNGGVAGVISKKDTPYTVPQGYHDGSGKVGLDPTEAGKLVPSNIRGGITILGVTGTMSGTEAEKPQQKTVTPKAEAQTLTPDEGYTCLSEVKVAGIPYSESPNSAGGITVTIAG